ncbi:hypothetical protein FOZ63_012780, partial [Perkinsus olseni]
MHRGGGGGLLLPSYMLVIILFIITVIVGIFTFKAQQECVAIRRELMYRENELLEAQAQLKDRSIMPSSSSGNDDDASIMEEIGVLRNEIVKLNEDKNEFDEEIEAANGNISTHLSKLVERYGMYLANTLSTTNNNNDLIIAHYQPNTLRTIIQLTTQDGPSQGDGNNNEHHHHHDDDAQLKNWMLDHVIDRIGLDVNIMSSHTKGGEMYYQIDVLRLTLL